MTLFGKISGRSRNTEQGASFDAPLIVAIHGGTYTSEYFDVPGYSLLDRAAANGLPIIALDRPSYGTTAILPAAQMTLRGQADYLTEALTEAWRIYGGDRPGMVIIGHSIGAAISAMIASKPDGLPLIGLALSGVCMRTPPEHRPMWESLPDIPLAEIPSAVKDDVMFGPVGSFADDMPLASHVACTTAPKAELVDIVSTWQDDVRDVLGAITVSVHYRQGEFDKLWIVDEGEVAAFEAALCNSRRVDAKLMHGTGHCMDFHRVSAALHLQQLGFALQCAAES